MIDQECLEVKIQEWKNRDPTMKIFFRPKAANVDNDNVDGDEDDTHDSYDDDDIENLRDKSGTLLLVCQTDWQRKLLSMYGSELALLDANYRTTRYAVPLFFLVVKTNPDYQIVATFVCESESTESIEEALMIVKKWNPQFNPKNFMTDYSNEEITAIEHVFEG